MNTPVLTPEFCERGYNHRAGVSDHAQYFRRWAEDSARAGGHLVAMLSAVDRLADSAHPLYRETVKLFS